MSETLSATMAPPGRRSTLHFDALYREARGDVYAARHDPAKFFRAGLPGHRSIFRLDADGSIAGCGYRKA